MEISSSFDSPNKLANTMNGSRNGSPLINTMYFVKGQNHMPD